MSQPFVISMYSFKGGAGRTVCTANLAPRLAAGLQATAEAPLLMLDLDVDSMGLTILLSEHGIPPATPWDTATLLREGFHLGLEPRAKRFREEGMFDVTASLGMPHHRGVVKLLAGARMDAQQSRDTLKGGAEARIKNLLNFAADQGIPAILIDSASGLQPTAVLSHKISHVVVYCCRLTYQFMLGTETHLKLLVDECEKDGRVPRILLVPVAVPEVTKKWNDIYETRMGNLREIRGVLRSRNVLADVIEPPIPEVDAFKWNESVLDSDSQELASDERAAADTFDAIAACILKWNRDQFAVGAKK